MFIKINFLVISIVVLTIFVKMVPAPGDPDLTRITSKDFNEFKDLYKTEIKEFINKQENILKMPSLENDEMPADYALLYFKHSFHEFNRIHYGIMESYGSRTYINFMISRKNKENEESSDKLFSADELAHLKDLTTKNLTELYERTALSSLPNKIEKEYFFQKLRFIYGILKAISMTTGGRINSVDAMIKHYEDVEKVQANVEKTGKLQIYDEEAGEILDYEILKEFEKFNITWDLYNFNDSIFTEYNSMSSEDICTDGEINYMDNGVTITMNMFDAFLHYFKESLDKNYNIAINVDINELEETDQKLYYNEMLKRMKNIYDAYCIYYEKPVIETEFVQQMVNEAEKIKQKSNIKKELAEVVKQIQENSNNTKQDDSFEIVDSPYTKCYISNNCGLPDEVYFKDIMQYLIFQIAYNNQVYANTVQAITMNDD